MTYNNSKTIYYKEAKRLLGFAAKLEVSELLKKADAHVKQIGINELMMVTHNKMYIMKNMQRKFERSHAQCPLSQRKRRRT